MRSKATIISALRLRTAVSCSLFVGCMFVMVFAGCENSTGPVSYPIPYGSYWREEFVGGERHTRSIVLTTFQEGDIFDTVFTEVGGSWRIDSTTHTRLTYQQLSDGYLRTIEKVVGAQDSMLRYWYFFRRSDSLFYYVGDRLPGSNVSLEGRWASDVRDTALTGRDYSLLFGADSVEIRGRYSDAGIVSGMFAYSAQGSNLSVSGPPAGLGPRYEVVPGMALYLTTRATGGFVKR